MGPLLWISTRSNCGTCANTRYQDEVFYPLILDPSLSYQDEILAYHTAIKTDFQTGIINGTYPHAHADSYKIYPDNPAWNESIHGNESEYYIAAMKKYISQLVK